MNIITRLMIATVLGACGLVPLCAGCGGPPQLMETPNLYADGQEELFTNVPPEFQSNEIEVLYLTDRAREKDSKNGQPRYGHKRSRSVALGVSRVRLGEKDTSWEDVVQESTSRKRTRKLEVQVVGTEELLRFPPTPRTLVELPDAPAAHPTTQPSESASTLRAVVEEEFEIGRQLLEERLAKTSVKDVYVFIHGVKTSFAGSVATIAEMWHFLGREGVPVAYSWPAGGKGLLRGYNYDYNSSEFTVYHLKQALRVIASCPSVRKIHLVAHSRGTDVVTSAIRELHLEISGSGKSTREELKLGALVLAAPDLDVDVVIQRAMTARLGQVPEQSVLYICAEDEALGFSRWLFGGMRLGKLQPDIFTTEELDALRRSKNVSIVDARVTKPGSFGHNYFYSNPAVSSDLILVLRYGKLPGGETGRPLRIEPNGFWMIEDGYPTKNNAKSAKGG